MKVLLAKRRKIIASGVQWWFEVHQLEGSIACHAVVASLQPADITISANCWRPKCSASVTTVHWHRLITSQQSANVFLAAAFRPSLNSLAIANQFAPFKNAFRASVTAHQAVRRSLLQTKTNSLFYRTVLFLAESSGNGRRQWSSL